MAIGAISSTVELHVVARHHHLGARRQLDRARHVRRAEVELRAVVREERRVTAALFLGQDVGLGLELRVRRHRARLAQHLAALDAVTVDTAQKRADVVARFTAVQQLAEHLNARAGRLLRVADADDFDLVAHVDHAALNTAGHNRTATRDREHVLDRHQERLVNRTLRRGMYSSTAAISSLIAFFADPVRVAAFHRRQSRALATIGMSSPGKSYSTAARGLPSRRAPEALRRRPGQPCS